MKVPIVLLIAASLAAVCLAAPVPDGDDTQAQTLRLENANNGVDKYNFSYETSNGIARSEQGELKTTADGAAIVVQGSTSWTAPDGKRYEIVFNADETGYHPSFKLAN